MPTTQIEKMHASGIQRRGSVSRGFSYQYADGRRVPAKQTERIRSLAIPPAWRDVAIASSATAKLQALGMDQAGRWQYRYHPSYVAKQGEQKYQRLIDFAQALPQMRRAVNKGLSQEGLGRDRVLACMLRILSTCFIRAGSQEYADEHGAYGISTLLKKHVKVHGNVVTFDYPGKSHQEQHRMVEDARVAKVVRALLKQVPGQSLFQYRKEDGTWLDIRRTHLNDYIHEVMGEDFTAKDFRTWAGTLMCACSLARDGVVDPPTKKALKGRIVAAIKETAQVLGNTPAICKSSYIYPSVIVSFEKGEVLSAYFSTAAELRRNRGVSLHASERELLKLLRTSMR